MSSCQTSRRVQRAARVVEHVELRARDGVCFDEAAPVLVRLVRKVANDVKVAVCDELGCDCERDVVGQVW